MPDLPLSQTCGYNIAGTHHGRLVYVATPRFDAPGCEGSLYSSHIVVPASSVVQTLQDLRGLRCAINGYASHSGCNALRSTFARLATEGRFFSSVVASGGHALSLKMLAEGQADVAAVDCVVYALLARHRPQAVENLRIIGRTVSVPVGPYIASAGSSVDMVARLRTGLLRAADDPDMVSARHTLLIRGFEILGPEDYSSIVAIEADARRLGYRDFEQASASAEA
jgi:ABC-type phosphate/phosphonate transport system substrate-binding protein